MATPGKDDPARSPARPVDDMTFEEALHELEAIVSGLEEGRVPLEQSIAMYDRGDALRKRCDELLRNAEAKIEKIRIGEGGKAVGSEPLDGE